VAPPAAAFFFFTSVPFSGIATRGFEPDALDGAVEVGAIVFGVFADSFILFPLAEGFK
jgi:hypothetical protein